MTDWARMSADGTTCLGVSSDNMPAMDRNVVDITELSPQPTVGWTYTNGVWTAPQHELNRETLVARAQAALTDNQDFLALPTPSQGQLVVQVQALTRQMDALLRIVFDRLDATS